MTLADEELIRLIDQRIRADKSRIRHTGTVVSRDTTGPKGMVQFDGATVATPVKFAGGVYASPNDRCLLDLYGTSDWIVTNTWAASTFGEASKQLDGLPATTGALTSNTFVDLTEFGTITFTKFFDATFIRVAVQWGAFSSATATQLAMGVRLTPTAGAIGFSATDYALGRMYFNVASKYENNYTPRRLVGVPAGTYTCSLRWRRVSGAGNIQADAITSYALELDERVRATVPVL